MSGRGAASLKECAKWFLEMESTPGEDVLKIVYLTTDGEYYINLVEKICGNI